uniref:Uncharacterized protein n=1 Tax=Panthera tigris altaica TaxID=74533 RepID=A0A8C9KVG3_PANTA
PYQTFPKHSRGGNTLPFSAAMATMQGMEGTISEAGPGGYQLEQPPVIQSHLWKRMPEKFLKGEPKVLGVIAPHCYYLWGIFLTCSSEDENSSAPSAFLSGVWGRGGFIISGSLSVVAGIRTTKGLSLDAVALLLTVLEFFVALTLSVFGCKVTCCHPGGVVLILPSNPHVAETASPTPFTEV